MHLAIIIGSTTTQTIFTTWLKKFLEKMDTLAIELVQIWNAIATTLGAHSLIMRESPGNGYMLGLIVLSIFSGGGFFVLFPIGDDADDD